MDPQERKVYLTFDDGPIPEATPEILDILAREDVKATFFMVGDNVRKYPEIARRVIDEGHAVGNHTFHHIKALGMGTASYRLDVVQASGLSPSRLFRPPHGWLWSRQWRVHAARDSDWYITTLSHATIREEWMRGEWWRMFVAMPVPVPL